MYELDGTTIFWLIALGMLVGGIAKLALGNRGVGFVANVIWGAAGSLIVGGIGVALQLPGSLLLAFLGSLSILFLTNIFYLQEDEHAHEA